MISEMKLKGAVSAVGLLLCLVAIPMVVVSCASGPDVESLEHDYLTVKDARTGLYCVRGEVKLLNLGDDGYVEVSGTVDVAVDFNSPVEHFSESETIYMNKNEIRTVLLHFDACYEERPLIMSEGFSYGPT